MNALVFVNNWQRLIVYPKVIHRLRTFCKECNVDFEPFERFCQAADEPWASMLFTPFNDLQMTLAGKVLTSFIDPMLDVLVSPLSVIHCHLNVQFEGAMAQQLTELLSDVCPASSALVRSAGSIVSMTAPTIDQATATSMDDYLISDVAGHVVSKSGDVPPVNISNDSFSLTPGLQNVYTETVPALDSDVTEEEVHFSYDPDVLESTMSPSAAPRGFPGDALFPPLSRHRFGFTHDFLCDAGAHFKMRVMRLWDTSLHVDFLPCPHAHPAMFLLARMVVHTDEEPLLSPIPEVSSVLEPTLADSGGDASAQCSSRHPPSAVGGPCTILHWSLPVVGPGPVDCPAAADISNHGVHWCPDGSIPTDPQYDSSARSHSLRDSAARADPPWDSHGRDGFRTSQSYNQLVAARDGRPYAFGASWMFWHENPQDLDFRVDPHTGTVRPWYGHHVDYGEVLCHPVSVTWWFQDKELYLSCFQLWPFNVDQWKQLFCTVPPYGETDNFLLWYSHFVSVLMGFGLYVPPAQMVRDGDPLGIWFGDLPAHVQVDVETVFGDIVASILCSKSTGFIVVPALSQIIHQHDNGYDIIYDLLVHAGHPFLQSYPLIPPQEPHQHLDCKVSDYCLEWNVYMLQHALHGEYLSDRFFMQQFLSNMHRSLQTHVHEWLEQAMTNTYIHGHLSHTFSPDRLFMKIIARVHHLGQEHLALDSPRESSRSAHLVRTITVPLADDPDHDLLVAAVTSSTACTCFLCAKDHLLLSCPLLADIQKDSFCRKALLRALAGAGSSSVPGASSKQVHAVLSAPLLADDPVSAPSVGASDADAPSADF